VTTNSNGWIAGFIGALLLVLGSLPGAALAQTVTYVHTDALGSIVAETDATGAVISRREYEPYGLQLTPAVQDGPGYRPCAGCGDWAGVYAAALLRSAVGGVP